MTGVEPQPMAPHRAKAPGFRAGWRPTLSVMAVLSSVLIPSIALACPACAGNQDGGIAYFVLLGSMILLPFAITGVTALVLRQARLEDE